MTMIANSAKHYKQATYILYIDLITGYTEFVYGKDFEQQQSNKPEQSTCNNWKLKLNKDK